MPVDPPDSTARKLLSEGELTLVGRIVHASNATLVCEASSDGRSIRCVYKPVRGERPLWDFPHGTLAGREVASYLISEELGWGVIPRTILRDGPLGPGMVQQWIDTPDRHPESGGQLDLIDICPPEEVPPGWLEVLRALDVQGAEVALIHADDPRLQRVAVLDVLLNNADRKGGHALEGIDGSVYGIDHGICLHEEYKLRTVLWGWSGQPIGDDLMVDIESFVKRLGDEFVPVLAEYITLREIDALRGRAKALLHDPVMPHPVGSRPIPWPAF
ncbi:SCO1664 family protein [Rhodococcus spongiicola]|uniref:SCO1664 family protein n=1 Tax=Rhodococcus spongiicola TaxID=2487352 RepID=A0A3S3E0R7_9NOCA|nr:SCO1664 family protein [Rhodococcus spongiicola]RVW03319.1 SCO1664 family protein [Rhodococcus spongiicola]